MPPGFRHIAVDGGARFANLLLGSFSRFGYRSTPGLLRSLPALLLGFEDREAGFAQALLVFLGLRFRCRDMRPSLEHRALSALTTLVQ
jgi:hypothetical protein